MNEIIGLTGGIATGKSTVSKYLTEMGAIILDGDVVSREVITYPNVVKSIKESFGKELFDRNDVLNRKRLGEVVFSNEIELAKLNSIMEPVLKKRISEMTRELNDENAGVLIVLDMPLLIEVGLPDLIKMDEIWLVSADEKNQLERLMKRNNLSKQEALDRINSQMSLKEKKKYATVIVDNSYDMEALKKQVLENYNRVMKKLK